MLLHSVQLGKIYYILYKVTFCCNALKIWLNLPFHCVLLYQSVKEINWVWKTRACRSIVLSPYLYFGTCRMCAEHVPDWYFIQNRDEMSAEVITISDVMHSAVAVEIHSCLLENHELGMKGRHNGSWCARRVQL